MTSQHVSRPLLALVTVCWIILTAGPAGADDDDDDDDDSSSSPSSVVTTWPPTEVEWPPRLDPVHEDEVSPAQVPIVMPSGVPYPPLPVEVTPTRPIVPTTATEAPADS